MFLRATTRKKDGKTHRYWSVVENRRLADGRVLQRHVLYLGEINDCRRSPGGAPSRCWTSARMRRAPSHCFPKTADDWEIIAYKHTRRLAQRPGSYVVLE